MAKPKSTFAQQGGIFAKIDFPDYQFREFPKLVGPKEGRVLVHDADEERAALNQATAHAEKSSTLKLPEKRA